MTRQVLGLQKDAYEYLVDALIQRVIKSESIDRVAKLVDLELSDNVIMKIYDTDLMLDLGARKAVLQAGDFREIAIR